MTPSGQRAVTGEGRRVRSRRYYCGGGAGQGCAREPSGRPVVLGYRQRRALRPRPVVPRGRGGRADTRPGGALRDRLWNVAESRGRQPHRSRRVLTELAVAVYHQANDRLGGIAVDTVRRVAARRCRSRCHQRGSGRCTSAAQRATRRPRAKPGRRPRPRQGPQQSADLAITADEPLIGLLPTLVALRQPSTATPRASPPHAGTLINEPHNPIPRHATPRQRLRHGRPLRSSPANAGAVHARMALQPREELGGGLPGPRRCGPPTGLAAPRPDCPPPPPARG